jgi:hypothetical protein
VTTAISCPRRAWLSERFSSGGTTSDKALLGTLLHQVFQATLAAVAAGQQGGEVTRDQVNTQVGEFERSRASFSLVACMGGCIINQIEVQS